MNKTQRSFWRVTSAVLAVVFSTTTVVWSAPDFGRALHPMSGSHHPVSFFSLPLDIPKEFGTVDEVFGWSPDPSHSGRSEVSRVILIRDAHESLSAQENIKRILAQLMAESGEKAPIFLEGAAGRIDTSLISRHPNEALRRSVAERLFNEGRIGGAELLNMLERPDIRLVGIEEPLAYRENFSAALSLLPYQHATLRRLGQMRRAFKGLMPYVCAPDLGEMLRRITEATHERNALGDHLAWLLKEARARNISLGAFSELKKVNDLFGDTSHDADIPASLDAHKLIEETESLEKELLDKAIASVKEKTFVRLYRELDLLLRAVALTLNPTEARYFLKYEHQFQENLFLAFLTSEGKTLELPTVHVPLERVLGLVATFYRQAFIRDGMLAEHVLARIEEEKDRAGIVVAGGFHTEGMAAHLREKGLAYTVITPRIGEEVSRRLYQKNLLRFASFRAATLNLPRLFDSELPALLPEPQKPYAAVFKQNLERELGIAYGFGADAPRTEEDRRRGEELRKWKESISKASDMRTSAQMIVGIINDLENGVSIDDIDGFAELFYKEFFVSARGPDASFNTNDINDWKSMRDYAYEQAVQILESLFEAGHVKTMESDIVLQFDLLLKKTKDNAKHVDHRRTLNTILSFEKHVGQATVLLEELEKEFTGSVDAQLFHATLIRTTNTARNLFEKIKLGWFSHYEALADRELKRYRSARKLIFWAPMIPEALAAVAIGDADADKTVRPYLKDAGVSEAEYAEILSAPLIESLTWNNREEFLTGILNVVEINLKEAEKYLTQAGSISERRKEDIVYSEVRPHQTFRGVLAERYLALSNAWGWEGQATRFKDARNQAVHNRFMSMGGLGQFAISEPLKLADMMLGDLEIARAMEALQEMLHVPTIINRAKLKDRETAQGFREVPGNLALLRFMVVNLSRRYSQWNELVHQVFSYPFDTAEGPSEMDLNLFDEALRLLAPESQTGETDHGKDKETGHGEDNETGDGEDNVTARLLSERGRRLQSIFNAATTTWRDVPEESASDIDKDIRRVMRYMKKLEEVREGFKAKESWQPLKELDRLLPEEPLLQSATANARDQGIMTLSAMYWSGVLYWGGDDSLKGSRTQKVHRALGYIINEGLLFRDDLRQEPVSMYELHGIVESNRDLQRLRMNRDEKEFLNKLLEGVLTPRVSAIYEKVRDIAVQSVHMSVGDRIDALRDIFSLQMRNYLRYVFGSVVEELKAAMSGGVDPEELLVELNQRIEKVLGMLHLLTGVPRPEEGKDAPPMARRMPGIEKELDVFKALDLNDIEHDIQQKYILRFMLWVGRGVFYIPFFSRLFMWFIRRAQNRVGITAEDIQNYETTAYRAWAVPLAPKEGYLRSILERFHLYRLFHASGANDAARLLMAPLPLIAANVMSDAWIKKNESFLKQWALWGEKPIKILATQQHNRIQDVRMLRRELLKALEDIYVSAFEFYRLESRRKLRQVEDSKDRETLFDEAQKDLEVARRRLDMAVTLSKEGARLDALFAHEPPPHPDRHTHSNLFEYLGRAYLHHAQSVKLYSKLDDASMNIFLNKAMTTVKDLWQEPYRVSPKEGVAEDLEFELIDKWLIPFGLRDLAGGRLLEMIRLGLKGVESKETFKKAMNRFILLERATPAASQLLDDLETPVEEIRRSRDKAEGEALRRLVEEREKLIQDILDRTDWDKSIQELSVQAETWGRQLRGIYRQRLEDDFSELRNRIRQSLLQTHEKENSDLIEEYSGLLSREAVYGTRGLTPKQREQKAHLKETIFSRGLSDTRIQQMHSAVRKRNGFDLAALRPPTGISSSLALAMLYASGVLDRDGTRKAHQEIAFIFSHGLLQKFQPHQLKQQADQNPRFISFIGEEKPFFDSVMRMVGLYPPKGFGAASYGMPIEYPVTRPVQFLESLGISDYERIMPDPPTVKNPAPPTALVHVLVLSDTKGIPVTIRIEYQPSARPQVANSNGDSLTERLQPTGRGLPRNVSFKTLEISLPLSGEQEKYRDALAKYVVRLHEGYQWMNMSDKVLDNLNRYFTNQDAGFGMAPASPKTPDPDELTRIHEKHRRLLAAYESIHHASVDDIFSGSQTLASFISSTDMILSKFIARMENDASVLSAHELTTNFRETFRTKTHEYEVKRKELWGSLHTLPTLEQLEDWEESFKDFGVFMNNFARAMDNLPIPAESSPKYSMFRTGISNATHRFVKRLSELNMRLNAESGSEIIDVVEVLKDIEASKVSDQRLKIKSGTRSKGYMIKGSRYSLEIILKNIMGNALRYRNASVQVGVRQKKSGDSVYIRIQDNGKGIEYDLFRQLFEPGLTKTEAGEVQGTGSGLFLIRYLTDLMGGTIDVTTRTGGGGMGRLHVSDWNETVAKNWTQTGSGLTGTVFELTFPLTHEKPTVAESDSQTPKGFGRQDLTQRLEDYYASSAFDGIKVDAESALGRLTEMQHVLTGAMRHAPTTPKIIFTGFESLPEDGRVIREFIDEGGEWVIAFSGSREEARSAFRAKYGIDRLGSGIEFLPYTQASEVSGKSFGLIRAFYEKEGVRYENMTTFYGAELREELKKISGLVSRVYDAPGGIQELKWEVVTALASLGPDHPAVRPFLAHENGLLRLVTLEELAERLIAAHQEFAKAA